MAWSASSTKTAWIFWAHKESFNFFPGRKPPDEPNLKFSHPISRQIYSPLWQKQYEDMQSWLPHAVQWLETRITTLVHNQVKCKCSSVPSFVYVRQSIWLTLMSLFSNNCPILAPTVARYGRSAMLKATDKKSWLTREAGRIPCHIIKASQDISLQIWRLIIQLLIRIHSTHLLLLHKIIVHDITGLSKQPEQDCACDIQITARANELQRVFVSLWNCQWQLEPLPLCRL